jgi:hypothetical protein
MRPDQFSQLQFALNQASEGALSAVVDGHTALWYIRRGAIDDGSSE